MNRSIRALALSLTTLSAGAQAGEVDLSSLLGNGDSTLSGGDVVYQLRDPAGTTVNVALSFAEVPGGASLQLIAFKFTGALTSQELRLFSTNLIRLGEHLFFLWMRGVRSGWADRSSPPTVSGYMGFVLIPKCDSKRKCC